MTSTPPNRGNRYGEELKKLELEITKVLLSDSLTSIGTAVQVFQVITGLLLASYVSLFTGLIKQESYSSASLFDLVYFLLILLFALSLAVSLIHYQPISLPFN